MYKIFTCRRIIVKYASFNGSDSSFEADLTGFRLEFTKRLDELKNTLVLLLKKRYL